MIDVLYVMRENVVQNFVNFKSDLEAIRATATPEQIQEVEGSIKKLQTSTGQAFSIDEESGTAIIPIVGTLTPKPQICVSLFDGSQTIYKTIVESVKMAESMASVKQIRFEFSSPGGFVEGVESAAIAIKQAKKPTIGVVTHQACSGAFWLLSQCDFKIAATPLAQVGSIGVIIEAIDRKKEDKERGIKRIVMTSRNAPNKFKDIATEEGQKKIIDHITKIESVFFERVAEGFSVSVETVKNDFGQGGVLIGAEAVKAGMLEKIDENIMHSFELIDNSQSLNINIKNQKGVSMSLSLNELLSQNPEARAEYESSISAAVKDERVRIGKLVKLSGVIMSDGLNTAIDSGISTGDFAEEQLTAQNAVRESASNVSQLGTVTAGAQVPKDSAVEGDEPKSEDDGVIMTEEQAKKEAKEFYGGDQ
jgi:ClpP class serine protease